MTKQVNITYVLGLPVKKMVYQFSEFGQSNEDSESKKTYYLLGIKYMTKIFKK